MKSKNTALVVAQQVNNYKSAIDNLDKGESCLDFSEVYLTKEQLDDLAERIADNPFIGHIVWGDLPKDENSKELVQQVENKLIENNKLYKSHPTDFIHGLLSSHSYQNSTEGNKVEFIVDSKGAPHVNVKYNEYLEDWRVERVFRPENADDYYSVLYVNDKTHHAVLAHRGTDIPGSLKGKNASLKADLIEILNHNIGVQQAASYVSTKEALEITQNLGYNFSTTGHSLGAWLAELSLYFCHMDFDYHQVKAVTFDSPGSKNQMDVFKSNVDNTETKVRTNQFDMVTYLSAPNIVNVCNQHVGTVYRLAPEINYPEFLKTELPAIFPEFVRNIIAGNKYYLDSLLSVSGHSLSPMLDVFNPETGKPHPAKYALVLDWPHIKHKANTEPSLGISKFVLDKTPFIGSLPDTLKNVTVNAVNKLFPRSIATLNSVSTVIASFLSGDTVISQLCETFRHFDLNTHDAGYLLKDLPPLDQFALTYEGHYRTKGVNPLQARLLTKYKGSIDWHLSQVAKTNAAILEKSLDDVSCKQLSIIKHGFKTEHIDGKNYVSLINQHQHNIKSIEQFKEYLARLIEVNPTIKSFLENRESGVTQIIEVRNHQDDYKDNIIASDLPERVSHFVGREKVFNKINQLLEINQTVAINAFTGTGKSSTALEYGYRAEDTGKIVRWFASDTPDKIKAHYRQLATDLGIKFEKQIASGVIDTAVSDNINITKESKQKSTPEQKLKDLINSVNNAITKLNKPILLIFDNLENYHDAKKYLVNLPKKLVKVIITTRDNNLLNNPKQHIILEPFSNEEAVEYIRSNLPDRANNKTIEDLIKLLGNKEGEIIPYRLSKAVGFLQENKLWSVPKYIEHIKQNPNIEQAETAILVESLQDSPIELQILQYAAFLDPDGMSIEIFKELLQIDEEQLQESIAKLEKLSLVSLNHKESVAYLKMHHLAQEEIIRYIDSNQNQEQRQLLTSIEIQQNLIVSLNNLMPKVTYKNNQSDWQVGGLYYSHIQKILDSAKGIILAEVGELYHKLGEYNIYALRNYKEALAQHLEALKTYQALYKENQGNHRDIADSLTNVGYAYLYSGQQEKGLDYLEQALVMKKGLYPGNHRDIADFLSELGDAYLDSWQEKKVFQYLKQALVMRKELYQDNPLNKDYHRDIIISLKKLGDIDENSCQNSPWQKKYKYQEQALVMRKELCKANPLDKDYHSGIISSLEKLGYNYYNSGQEEKGLKYHEQALAIRKELYQGNPLDKDYHSGIISSLEKLGYNYYNSGKKEIGLKYHEQALAIRKELYQGNPLDKDYHSGIISSLEKLGYNYYNSGKKEIGLAYLEQALAMRKELYQDNPLNKDYHCDIRPLA
jgi:tetratricopeptide (TPR) repeat protein